MSSNELENAFKSHSDDLKKRVEWIQKMIERQTQLVLNAQKTVEHYQIQLEAANLALEGLRAEYRKLVKNGGTASPSTSKE